MELDFMTKPIIRWKMSEFSKLLKSVILITHA